MAASGQSKTQKWECFLPIKYAAKASAPCPRNRNERYQRYHAWDWSARLSPDTHHLRRDRPLGISAAIGIAGLGHPSPIADHLTLHRTVGTRRRIRALPVEQEGVLDGVGNPLRLQFGIVLQHVIEEIAMDRFFLGARKSARHASALARKLRVRCHLVK